MRMSVSLDPVFSWAPPRATKASVMARCLLTLSRPETNLPDLRPASSTCIDQSEASIEVTLCALTNKRRIFRSRDVHRPIRGHYSGQVHVHRPIRGLPYLRLVVLEVILGPILSGVSRSELEGL